MAKYRQIWSRCSINICSILRTGDAINYHDSSFTWKTNQLMAQMPTDQIGLHDSNIWKYQDNVFGQLNTSYCWSYQPGFDNAETSFSKWFTMGARILITWRKSSKRPMKRRHAQVPRYTIKLVNTLVVKPDDTQTCENFF
jgi:hypothetical protein